MEEKYLTWKNEKTDHVWISSRIVTLLIMTQHKKQMGVSSTSV